MSKGEVELAGCPFCKGADIAASQDVCDAWTWGCADCAAEGPSAATKTEARVAWNRRAPATAPSRPVREAALVEAIRWALGEDVPGPEFTQRPVGASPFWWRKELRRRLDAAREADGDREPAGVRE